MKEQRDRLVKREPVKTLNYFIGGPRKPMDVSVSTTVESFHGVSNVI